MVSVCPTHSAGAGMGSHAMHAPAPAADAHDAHADHAAHQGHAASGIDLAAVPASDAPPPDDSSHQCNCVGDCCACAAVRVSPSGEVAVAAEQVVAVPAWRTPAARITPRRDAHTLPFATAPPVSLTA